MLRILGGGSSAARKTSAFQLAGDVKSESRVLRLFGVTTNEIANTI